MRKSVVQLARITVQMLQSEREALEASAAAVGRPSLSSEIMYRLRKSLADDGLLPDKVGKNRRITTKK